MTHRSSVNLDKDTAEIAKLIPNRSAFIRECIRRWYTEVYMENEHIHPTITSFCYPYSSKGVCQVCWPDGMPSKKDWLYYREMWKHDPPKMDKWIMDQDLNDPREFGFIIPKELPIEVKSRGEKGPIRRFLKRILRL